MDIVYVVGPGDRNEELRYSLRSLANIDHGEVWIAGHTPRWVTGARAIPVQKVGSRWRSSTANMRAACEHPDVSDPFVYFNDDFFVMRPCGEVPTLHRGTVTAAAAPWGGGSYARGALRTRDILVAHGIAEPLCYELHIPMIVHKAAMLEAIGLATAKVDPFHKRTAYGNLAGIGGEQAPDVKVHGPRDRFDRDGMFLSTNDITFARGDVGRHIRSVFPDPSPHEVTS